jgi:P27 family predicted phage terminase small subunit
MLKKLSPVTAAGLRQIAGRPLDEIPEPPAWMNDVGRQKFEEVAAYLVDLRAITAGEVALVEQYAACYSRWVQAEEALATGDPGWRTVISRGGAAGSSVPSEMMLQSMRSIEQLRKLGAALGLAPTERTRLPAIRVGGEDDEMETLLKRAGFP